MTSDTVLQICYRIFRDWLNCSESELPERLAEVKRFAAQFHSNPAGLGVCRSCWSLNSNGTRHGTCSGDCTLARGGAPCPT